MANTTASLEGGNGGGSGEEAASDSEGWHVVATEARGASATICVAPT